MLTSQEINNSFSESHKYNILNINGEFLTGKTKSIGQIVENSGLIDNYQFFTFVNNWSNYSYCFDITEEIFRNSNLSEELFEKGESKYFRDSFFDNLNALNITNKDLLNYVTERLLLNTITNIDKEFIERINLKIKNDLKRLLILSSFEVSVESLLADLFNKFYPLKDEMSNVSEYLIDNNPAKLLFIFDDLQILNPKIKQWLDTFNNYLTTKKINEFKIFSYEGDGSEITIGEFFDIDIIIISRDRDYSFLHTDFSNKSIVKKYEKPIETGFEKFPFNNIEYLIEYSKSDEQIQELDVIVQAITEILKYVPENYQKNIIFCSLFTEFDFLNFNLLDSDIVDKLEFEQLISTLEFISKGKTFTFKKGFTNYFETIAKEIFTTYEIENLDDIIVGIRSYLPNISILDFEIIRHLAYFTKFERQFLIENYYDNNQKVFELLDKYIHLFDRHNNIYVLKSDIQRLLKGYNLIKDKNEIDEINESIIHYNDSYRNEISRRNNLLNDDVINVSNELDSLNLELNGMNSELESNSKVMISIQNRIKQIEEKLKPFSKTNTNAKKTINLVALMLSVAIVFNSDRISEFIFDTKDNYDIVILFVLLLLLVLYGNGLIRYFRTKLQSEELHILKQELKKSQEEKYKRAEEIEILTADIRAKKAKINDLKQHIERSNNQILENKKKLILD